MAVVLFKRPLSYMLEPFDVESVKQLSLTLTMIGHACASMKPSPQLEEAAIDLHMVAASLDQFVTLLEEWQ